MSAQICKKTLLSLVCLHIQTRCKTRYNIGKEENSEPGVQYMWNLQEWSNRSGKFCLCFLRQSVLSSYQQLICIDFFFFFLFFITSQRESYTHIHSDTSACSLACLTNLYSPSWQIPLPLLRYVNGMHGEDVWVINCNWGDNVALSEMSLVCVTFFKSNVVKLGVSVSAHS